MSQENLGKTVCFDYSHNNTLTIESPSYAEFTQFLFGSSFRLGKIQAKFTSVDKLRKYKMVVIGGPREAYFDPEEIDVIVEYVKNGGSLLVINDEGGDHEGGTNLSELTQHFGFRYNSDVICDSMNFQGIQTRIVVSDFEPHPTSRSVDAIVQSSACSIEINELIEADENINIIPLAKASLNAYKNWWDGEEWIEEDDAPRSVMAVCSNFYEGKVIGLCTVSMFSSLSSSYGFFAMNNQQFITEIFLWLLESNASSSSDTKMISVEINYNLFTWMEKLVQMRKWGDNTDIINFAVKYLKDHYDEILNEIETHKQELIDAREKQLENLKNIEDQKERNQQLNRFHSENNILTSAENIDTAKELKEIMASLSNLTGGEVGTDFNIEELNKIEVKEDSSKPIASKKEITIPVQHVEEDHPDISSENAEDTTPTEEKKLKKENSDPSTKSSLIEEKIPKIDDQKKEEEKQNSEINQNAPEDNDNSSNEDILQEIPVIEDFDKLEKENIEIIEGKEEITIEPIDKEALAQSIKDQFTTSLNSKLNQPSDQQHDQSMKKREKKTEVDTEIDAALKALGSFDDFTKKLDEFKTLTEADGPMEALTKLKDPKENISDDELFE